jgi:nitroimidazol reductase NimA-like FMN-containing flavoprotein (pyridoxamine 5'-phosphate oxidase superfamily)
MAYGRVGNDLLLHGSSGSRLMRALAENPKICVSITELNGLKVARSTFHSGMHYRSVVIFGNAELIPDSEKDEALNRISDAMLPGRSSEVRPSLKRELAATLIIRVNLDETSVKISNNDVSDEPEDLNQGVWAGLVPISEIRGTPIPADEEAKSLPVPQSVKAFIAKR